MPDEEKTLTRSAAGELPGYTVSAGVAARWVAGGRW